MFQTPQQDDLDAMSNSSTLSGTRFSKGRHHILEELLYSRKRIVQKGTRRGLNLALLVSFRARPNPKKKRPNTMKRTTIDNR